MSTLRCELPPPRATRHRPWWFVSLSPPRPSSSSSSYNYSPSVYSEADDDDDVSGGLPSPCWPGLAASFCPECPHCRPPSRAAAATATITGGDQGRRGAREDGEAAAADPRAGSRSVPAPPSPPPSPPPPAALHADPPPLPPPTGPDPHAGLLRPHPSQLSPGWYFFDPQITRWHRPPATAPATPCSRPAQDLIQHHHRRRRRTPPAAPRALPGPSPGPASGWEVYHPAGWRWSAASQDAHVMPRSPPYLPSEPHPECLHPSPRDLVEGWYYYASASRRWWAFQNALVPAARGWWYFAPSSSVPARWVFGRAGDAMWCPCCPEGTVPCENIDRNGRYVGPRCEGPQYQSAGSPGKRGRRLGEKLREFISAKKNLLKKEED